MPALNDIVWVILSERNCYTPRNVLADVSVASWSGEVLLYQSVSLAVLMGCNGARGIGRDF